MNKRLVKSFLTLSVFLVLASCGHNGNYPGYKKTESGAYMKFYNQNEAEVMPRIGDEVTFDMAQYFEDTLLFTTDGDPIVLVLREADFVGDVVDGLLMMHVGDSASLAVPADSVFMVMLHLDEVPEEFAGKTIHYELKLLSVKPAELLAVEHRALMDSLRVAEDDFLLSLLEDQKNMPSESGLIVVEKTGKGRVAKMGDYVDFDFLMCTPAGDTVMNSFGVEPVEMQYGEEFICRGFNEALGMVPEGGMMHFVIPSTLAFDSIGYEQYIMPYTPLVVRLTMYDVMDKAEYDKKQADMEAQKEAEKQRLQAMESAMIENFIKTNGITETPTETGLYIIREQEGDGALAQWGDAVAVHYTLNNLKGGLVESSYNYGEPMHFTIGRGQMIPAIEEALMTMAPGAKVTLVTPSKLAFGEFEIDKELLPAYSPMKIELELVEIE